MDVGILLFQANKLSSKGTSSVNARFMEHLPKHPYIQWAALPVFVLGTARD